MKRSFCTIATIAFLAVPAVSQATTCYYAPHDNDATGDNSYVQLWSSRQDIVDFFWEVYDFDKGDWDDGFGYWAPNDVNQPLARTFNALYALQYSSPTPPTHTDNCGGNILEWGPCYAQYGIDELDGRCGNGTKSGASAHTQYGYVIDNYTELYWPFFYGETVVKRAATIVHESVHAHDWVGHDDDHCVRHASCDDDWAKLGANMFEVNWLWRYSVEGAEISKGLRDRAREAANTILTDGFNNPPPYHVPDRPPTF